MSEAPIISYEITGVNANIALIILSRPKVNAFNDKMLDRLEQIFRGLQSDSQINVAIITAEGKAFSAGADYNWVAKFRPKSLDYVIRRGQEVFALLDTLSIPVIAAVNGYAIGGGMELALTCDIRIASTAASFGLPEVSIAIIPGWGGTTRLPKVVNSAVARNLILTGRRISAEEALRLHIVSAVYPPDQLQTETLALAEMLAQHAPIAIERAKNVLYSPLKHQISDGLKAEQNAENICFSSKDMKRLRRSIFLKRQPKFKGN